MVSSEWRACFGFVETCGLKFKLEESAAQYSVWYLGQSRLNALVAQTVAQKHLRLGRILKRRVTSLFSC